MLDWNEYAKFLVTLLLIVDPVGTIPIFIAITRSHRSLDRKRIAAVGSVAVAAVLVLAALIGEFVLQLFGITIASFKAGAAVLILLMAISMIQAEPTREKQTPEEAEEAREKESIAVVPLALPLLAGPGAISTTIIFAAAQGSLLHRAVIVMCCILVAVVSWLALRVAGPLSGFIGKTGINIAVRLMGVILAAIALEIFAEGIRVLLPGLDVTRRP